MKVWVQSDGGYLLETGGTIPPNATGDARDRLAKLLADPTTEVIPPVPPLPQTDEESRDSRYRSKLDFLLRRVVLGWALLEKIPDTTPNAILRAKVQARVDAAETLIKTIADEIEQEFPG